MLMIPLRFGLSFENSSDAAVIESMALAVVLDRNAIARCVRCLDRAIERPDRVCFTRSGLSLRKLAWCDARGGRRLKQ